MTARLLFNRYTEIARDMERKADRVVEKAAHDCSRIAMGRVPVLSGNLRGSISVEQVGERAWSVIVGAEYAAFVEYGTSTMAAQPYLNPAFDAVKPGFLAAMSRLAGGGR